MARKTKAAKTTRPLEAAVSDDRMRELAQTPPLTIGDSSVVSYRRRLSGISSVLEQMLPEEGQEHLPPEEVGKLLDRRDDPAAREILIEDGRLTVAEEVSHIIPLLDDTLGVDAADLMQEGMICVVEATDEYDKESGRDYCESVRASVRAGLLYCLASEGSEKSMTETLGNSVDDLTAPPSGEARERAFMRWVRQATSLPCAWGRKSLTPTQARRFRMWMEGASRDDIAGTEDVRPQAVQSSIKAAVKKLTESYRAFNEYHVEP